MSSSVRARLSEAVAVTLRQLGLPIGEQISVTRPTRPEHGDWSSNAALVAAAGTGRKPREIAQKLAEALTASPPAHVASVEVAGPGFVNFRLHPSWLWAVLAEVVAAGQEGYGRPELGGGRRVNVEFVSANPTGPLHVGAGRWAAYGDSLCRLLERCGYQAHREYYVNDRGTQTALFGASLAAHRQGFAVPADGYQGAYVAEWAAEMPDDADPESWGRDRVLADVSHTVARMGVVFDTWFSERSLVDSGALEATLADLAARGLVRESDGATWLVGEEVGLAKDEVLVRTGGEPTYFLADIAYHHHKFARGFDHLIDVLGADHHGHVARLRAAVAALGHDFEALEVVVGQLVSVTRGGEVVKMGKRSGDFVELAEVLDEVGPDAARLSFLLGSVDTRQVFDLEAVVATSMDNAVHYVQYAHARMASVMRTAAERGVQRLPLDAVDLSTLTHPRELEVLRKLSELEEVLVAAAEARAPHRVTTWVRELAAEFNGFYHDCPILRSDVDPPLAQARLWVVEAARTGLVIGLDLLGVSAPEQM
ncbi:MAG: arginine--tRNA ligase [Acidimicrobiales bacterium]